MRLAANSKPMARLRLFVWSQRKLFLLVFLWTGLCLVILNSGRGGRPLDDELAAPADANDASHRHHQRARSAASLQPSAPSSASGSFSSSSPAGELEPPTTPPVNEQQQQQQQASEAPEHIKEAPQDKRVSIEASRADGAAAATAGEAPVKQASETTSSTKPTECHYDYPNLFDLQFNNIHWQKFSSSAREPNLTQANLKPAAYYLYNAYYDDRWRAGQPSVRLLAMIDRIRPPPTDCLLWSSKLTYGQPEGPRDESDAPQPKYQLGADAPPSDGGKPALRPLVTRAQFVYAWYPKWGNYEDGLLQPWIVTCPIPREHIGLVPDSVSLADVPGELELALADQHDDQSRRRKRDAPPSMPMPPSFSSSSSSSSPVQHLPTREASTPTRSDSDTAAAARQLDCSSIKQPISNNLPVYNRRPSSGQRREKFAVCVKGLDFPDDSEHVSVRLVEWIELLNLLGAKKIFLYTLNVHENISKVLQYYQRRGMVELSPLTLPGDQPNLPELQHLYLKQKLTSKRQNELLPYNDCLYRNLHSYEYLALLDIDEIIMPLRRDHQNWYDLMHEVERSSLAEQNYSRASYNVRNVYFFDDLSGPMGTTPTSSQSADDGEPAAANERPASSLTGSGGSSRHDSAERGIPHYMHMMSHVYRSKNYTEPGQYVKCFHNTERVISLHNHFPMNCFGQCTTYSIPVDLAHLQHYRKDCVGPLRQSCKNDFRLFTTRDTTIWKFRQRMMKRTTRALSHLGLLAGNGQQQEPVDSVGLAS